MSAESYCGKAVHGVEDSRLKDQTWHSDGPSRPPSDATAGGNAVATINQLKASGADVRVNRIGSAPLDECIVTNVNTFSRPAQIIPIDDDDINVFTTFPKPKVTVTLNCSQ